MPEPSSAVPSTGRVASVDALRGLTILLMVFVNDLGPGAPAWMHHIQPPNADGMTLADIVFPGFLFIAGVSIPLAFDNARRRGATTWGLLGHCLVRGLALIVMGLVEFNRDDITWMRPAVWGLLAYIAILMAWCVVPREPGTRRNVFVAIKTVGILGLVTLLAIYRREPVDTEILFYGPVKGWTWLTTGWWGILGLIGWAYLTVSLLYLLVGGRREWLMGLVALLMVNFLAMEQGGFFERVDDKAWLGGARAMIDQIAAVIGEIGRYVGVGGTLGSLPAITMCGCVLGTVLLPGSGMELPRQRARWGLGFAIGLGVAGLMTDTFAGINKINATPTWCLWCAGLTCLVWVVLYLVMDVWGWTGWSIVVRPAGANPLVAYLLHPIVIWIISLAGLYDVAHKYSASANPWVVVGGSAAMALIVCGLTGLLGKAGLRMRV